MRKLVIASLAAASLCAGAPKPAQAYGGGGFVFGTVLGLGVGTVIGSSIARPYGYGYYPYAGYPYAYYPPVAYPYPYAYAYPPVPLPPPGVAYAPPAYLAPPPAVPAGQPAAYAPPSNAVPAPATVKCRTGQFFNTLTGNCDRR